MTSRRSWRLGAWASTACLTVAATGCGGRAADTRLVLVDAAGRGLQPPWWTAIPAPTPQPAPINIPADALFATGAAEVRPADRPRLEAFAHELAKQLNDTTGLWTIVGATDTTGHDNVVLGQARADAVAEILTTSGSIDRRRIRTASWGDTCLAVDETTAPDLAQARAQNRRVAIVPPGATPTCLIP